MKNKFSEQLLSSLQGWQCKVWLFRNVFPPCFGVGLGFVLFWWYFLVFLGFFDSLLPKMHWREKRILADAWSRAGAGGEMVAEGPGLPEKPPERGSDPTLLFVFNPGD